jgi:hypothetical protein
MIQVKKSYLLPGVSGLCKESLAACGGERFFGWRHLFLDFASQNQEKDASIQIIIWREAPKKNFLHSAKYYFTR